MSETDGSSRHTGRLAVAPGLCGDCRRAEIVGSARSSFMRCRGADTDRRLPRYPALPVRRCFAYEPAGETT